MSGRVIMVVGLILLGIGLIMPAKAGTPVVLDGPPLAGSVVLTTVIIDGVRCVVLTGQRGNALSCNWTTPPFQ